MTDEEWRKFKLRKLIENNIYLSDAQRMLYESPVALPDATRDVETERASLTPDAMSEPRAEALSPSVANATTSLDIMLGRVN